MSQEKVNQQMYILIICIYLSRMKKKLKPLHKYFRIYSQDIGMEFEILKWAILLMKKEKKKEKRKVLGILEAETINLRWKKLKKESLKRTKNFSKRNSTTENLWKE